jgi:long-chain acyl-CoA synthetase
MRPDYYYLVYKFKNRFDNNNPPSLMSPIDRNDMTENTNNLAITIEENDAIRNANSFLEIFYERVKLHPNKVYLRQPHGSQWNEYTWKDVSLMARKILSALRDMDLEPGDHIGILSKNCNEWIIADLAILMGGYVSVPFYPTLPANELREVIELSHVKALFVGKLETWELQRAGVPSGIRTISMPHYHGNSKVKCEFNWKQLLAEYAPAEQLHKPAPDEIFTLIYTSGTTGTPKGVMLDYQAPNLIMQHERDNPVYGIYQNVGERIISYLPLNHIAERVLSEVMPIVSGGTVSFSESLDHFGKNLQSVQPTLFFAVPRIWTKFQQAILSKMSQRKLDLLLSLPLVSGIIKQKIKTGMGLNECRCAISGAAPMSSALIRWFAKLDINIQEVYGATELCGGVTFNPLNDIAPGTVGKPLPGVELKLAANDEVLIKAPWVMKGYYESDSKTAEVLQDGYYHTGDTGKYDDAGRLIITGRIKDTFKTAKGKFVLPVPIEHQLSRNFLIEQVMVTGMGLTQPFALICLSESASSKTRDDLSASLGQTLTSINAELDGHERLSHFIIFREPWQEDSGFYTPTLKLKRHVIDQHYKDKYETWTQSKIRIIWEGVS